MRKFFLFLNAAFLTLSFSVNGARFKNNTDRTCQVRSVYKGRDHMRISILPGNFVDIETDLYDQLVIQCGVDGKMIEFKPNDNNKNFIIKFENGLVEIK